MTYQSNLVLYTTIPSIPLQTLNVSKHFCNLSGRNKNFKKIKIEIKCNGLKDIPHLSASICNAHQQNQNSEPVVARAFHAQFNIFALHVNGLKFSRSHFMFSFFFFSFHASRTSVRLSRIPYVSICEAVSQQGTKCTVCGCHDQNEPNVTYVFYGLVGLSSPSLPPSLSLFEKQKHLSGPHYFLFSKKKK